MRRLDTIIFFAIAVVLAAASWLASWLSGTPLIGFDDADIFFVYARNLIEGHGLVYNAGGERVEGFTSSLWLVICTAAAAITSHFEIVLLAVNVGLIAVAAWVLHGYLTDLLQRFAGFAQRRAVVISLALIGAAILTPGFVTLNVVSLMDSGLWSSLLLLGVVATLRSALDRTATPTRFLPAVLPLLVMARPEALLWGPVLIALSVLLRMASGTRLVESLRSHLAAVMGFALTCAAIFAFRLAYFGYAFPNTYYAKAGDPLGPRIAAGAEYFADFAVSNPAIPLAIVAAIWTLCVLVVRYRSAPAATTRPLLTTQAAMLVIWITGCTIPIIEGGDHFGFWRMYQPIAPLVAVQACITLAVASTARARVTWVAAAALVTLLVPWRHWLVLGQLSYASPFAPGGGWNTPRVEISIAQDMQEIGDAFNQAFTSDQPSVGVIVAGGFAFHYRGATIDLMGLNNVVMAHATGPRYGMRNHAAFDPDVFFKLKPDILLLSLWSPQRPDWFGFPMLSGAFDGPPNLLPGYFERRSASMAAFDSGVLKGLLQRIGGEYAWASVRPDAHARWIHAVFNRDYLKRLSEKGYEIVLPGAPRAR